MAASHFRVRVVRGDFQFEAEGDRKFINEMLAKFVPADDVRITAAQKWGSGKASGATTLTTAAKTVSVGEFIRQFGFKRHTDIVLAFGYYMEQHMGLKEFTPADINNLYYEAKMESSNTSQAIVQNIRRGRLMPAKAKQGTGRKKYTLTSSGETFLRARLEKATSEKSSK
jgi:predicted transcriptional regulator